MLAEGRWGSGELTPDAFPVLSHQPGQSCPQVQASSGHRTQPCAPSLTGPWGLLGGSVDVHHGRAVVDDVALGLG